MDWTEIDRVLVPLDGSGTAEWALGAALRIAAAAGAEVRLIRCLSSLTRAFPDVTAAGYLEEWEERQHAAEAEYLGALAGRLREAGHAVEARTAEGQAVRVIVDAAADADLVVMTAHGWSGPERAWLGHVADGVVHHLRRPVLVVRARSETAPVDPADAVLPLDRILIATDGSPAARAAERHAAGLGRLLNAPLTLFRAVPAPAGPSSPYIPHAAALDREVAAAREEEARRYLEERAADMAGLEVQTVTRPSYRVAREILAVAEEIDADLLAVGTHRDSRLARVVLGSVADKVVRGSRAPVLIAHAE